jgi:methylmalonyl-CoA mutase
MRSARALRRCLTTKSTTKDWRAVAEREAKKAGTSLEALTSTTKESLEIQPCYGTDESAPGVFPYRRGAYATMYAAKPWTVRQYAGFSSAEESNAFYRNAVREGQQGLSVAFDLPSHRGYDSDHPRAQGDVGLAGVPVDTVEDFRTLFDGIELDKMSVSMTMNGAVLPTLAMFVVAAEESGVERSKLKGTIQNDILKEFMVRNTYIYPPGPSLRATVDIMGFCAQYMPKFHSLSVSGYHMHEAGADAATELAFTIADGLEYVRVARDANLDLDAVCSRLSFFFAMGRPRRLVPSKPSRRSRRHRRARIATRRAGMDHHVEIAKLRAARQLWAEELKKRHGDVLTNEKAFVLRTHVQTSGYSLTAQDPLNNVARTALEALAAVHGGAQSLHTNAFDEALALPSDGAARVARDTQLLLQQESGVCRVADPWGGSFFMEALTDDLLVKAREILAAVDENGGMRAHVESGDAKRRIEACAARTQARVDGGEDVVVGVNDRTSSSSDVDVRIIDNSKALAKQLARLQKVRETRDSKRCAEALDALRRSAALERSTASFADEDNLVARSIECARVRCTLGEMSDALRDVWGEHHALPTAAVGSYAAAAPDGALDALREECVQFEAREGRRPKVLIAKVGMDGHDRGANVVAAGLVDLGFEVVSGPLFATPEEVAAMALEHEVHVVGVSTMAAGHRVLVPRVVEALRGAPIAVVVGGVVPESDRAALHAAGVSAVFGPGSTLPDVARVLLKECESEEREAVAAAVEY